MLRLVQFARLSLRASGCLLVSAAVLVSASGCEPPFGERSAVPFDIRTIIPREWTPITKLIELNVDDDPAMEWLLFYRYDVSAARKERGNLAGPIGGVVFDRQIDPNTGVSVFARHDLLPDIREGKGQGFLGEERCEARIYKVTHDGDVGENLAVFGYAYGPIAPVYLSIFRKKDDGSQGYQFELLGHFYGDGGVGIESDVGNSDPLYKVVVKTRLNERSLISKKTIFERRATGDGYEPKPEENRLEFTYGIPDNPYYPEAAVLAYYQLMNAGRTADADKFVLPSESRRNYWQKIHGATEPPPPPAWPGGVVRVLTLAYSGASKIVPGGDEPPFYYTTVEVEESTGAAKVWEVFGLLDGRCGAEICWKLMSWQPR